MQQYSKTKIIATLGPASNSREQIRRLIVAGVNCFRLNFSHGDGESMQPYIDNVRAAAHREGAFIPILADIQGPKLRIGKMPAEGATLVEDEPFMITQRQVEGDNKQVHTPYEYLTEDVHAGTKLLLSDGMIELLVEEVVGQDVLCKIVHGGHLFSNKGLNIPGERLSVETLTPKDCRDLEFLSKSDIDMVAISFVRTAEDIVRARDILNNPKIPVMAKLELSEALDNLDEILAVSDGVMVARGDLGVEMEFERVPTIQKLILRRVAQRGKWAVVATQMLGSMVVSSRPSRAEVSDVANAVLDGADTVMLSEETAAGKHPLTSVEAMRRIVREAENNLTEDRERFEEDIISFAAGAAGAAVIAAGRLNAKAIVALAGSGTTALLVSKWRPKVPILALNTNEPTLRRLNVLRGVVPIPMARKADIEQQLQLADQYLVAKRWARPGDVIVIVAATGDMKETNTIRFHRVRNPEGLSG